MADPAGPNQTQHRRGAHVNFERVQHVGNEVGLNLRYDTKDDALNRGGPDGRHRLQRSAVDRLQRFVG
ncbi:hypothetical protein D3C75_1304570 [compost metagenome]